MLSTRASPRVSAQALSLSEPSIPLMPSFLCWPKYSYPRTPERGLTIYYDSFKSLVISLICYSLPLMREQTLCLHKVHQRPYVMIISSIAKEIKQMRKLARYKFEIRKAPLQNRSFPYPEVISESADSKVIVQEVQAGMRRDLFHNAIRRQQKKHGIFRMISRSHSFLPPATETAIPNLLRSPRARTEVDEMQLNYAHKKSVISDIYSQVKL